MNPSDNATDLPAAAEAPAPTEAEPAAKKRRPRPVAAVATPAETVAVTDRTGADAAAASAPTKPRRTRRKPDAVPAEAAPADAGAAAAAAPAEMPPLAVTTEAVAAVPPPRPVDPGAESADDAAARSDAQRRRNRNRRRGRRGGAGGEGSEGDDGAEVVTVSASLDDDEEGERVETVEAGTPVDAADAFAYVVSDAFDTETAEAEGAAAERRVLAAEPDAPKLHKVLAQAGIGSRRDMEELIAAGQVRVNGQVAHTGQRVVFGDRIAVAGRLIKVRIAPLPARVIAYHKPVGEVVTRDDPQQRPTVFRRLPRLPQGKWQSVGRLDINTEGLLLFTNSGELANQLMHPRFGVEREYAVRVIGRLDDDARTRLLEGVEIDGQRAAFQAIVDGGGEGVNHWYRVVIREGRNREVRKLFDKVGLGVSRLIRIRYGCVVLPRGLKRGMWVDLSGNEVRELRQLTAPGAGPRPESGEFRSGGKRNRRNRRGGDARDQRGQRDQQGMRDADRPRPHEGDEVDFGAIPNPLQQTFDKRAIREARQPRREIPEDGPIPNPLEQTYDRRFVQKPRGAGGKGGGGNPQQPDPMKTSVGYIGADAFVRKFQGGSGGRWGGKRGGGGRR